MKKLTGIERQIIALANPLEYNVYRCAKDGVFANRKDTDNGLCAYCKKQGVPVENIEQLYKECRNELGLK
ncbi:MAG: hypothetical protein RRY33_08135 [Alistipes sp.]